MRSVALLLVLAVALAGCSGRERRAPSTTTPSSSFTPSRVSVAPPPSAAWTTAATCPTTAAMKATFGAQTRPKRTSATSLDCVFSLGKDVAIDVTVLDGTVESNRAIWERPPASIVRDAPELAPGAVVVYTPPAGIDQCLVAVDHAPGTLSVQVTRFDGPADRQGLCAPLGPMLRLLAAR